MIDANMYVTISLCLFVRSAIGYAHLSAGLCCGLSGLAAGMAIGIVGDAGVRAVGQQEKLFVGMILILIFAEALGLYGKFKLCTPIYLSSSILSSLQPIFHYIFIIAGMIVALILSQQSFQCVAPVSA